MDFASLTSNLPSYLVPSNHFSVSQAPRPQVYSVRGVQMTPEDLATLRNTLFAEISNRNPQKQQLEARTIINTALNRIPQYKAQGKDMTLSQVLSEPKQYQGYGSAEYQRIAKNATTTTDSQKLGAIDAVLNEVKSGHFADTTAGSVYYHHDPVGRILLKPGTLYKQPARTIADLTKAP